MPDPKIPNTPATPLHGFKPCEFCGEDMSIMVRRDIERKRFCNRKCQSSWLYRNQLIPNNNFGSALPEERERLRRDRQAASLKKHWETHVPPQTGIQHTEEAKIKISESQKKRIAEHPESVVRGSDHPRYKKHKSKSKYREVYAPWHPRANKTTGRIREHILVAEKMLGRYLADGEVVHHKNENKSDNRPANLQVMTSSEHTKLHIDQEKKLKSK